MTEKLLRAYLIVSINTLYQLTGFSFKTPKPLIELKTQTLLHIYKCMNLTLFLKTSHHDRRTKEGKTNSHNNCNG